MRLVLAAFTASVLFVAGRSAAQDALTVEAETFVKAQPRERRNPGYPSQALALRNEGWVVVSYVISPTGEVVEAMIEDSSGVEGFEKSALNAVSRWRYTPATINGEPVEQSMVKTRLTFALEGEAKGATRAFASKYREIRTLLEAGDYAAAEPLLVTLEFGGRANLYEDAMFWVLKYSYLEASQSTDTEEKLRALRLAIGYVQDYLPPDTFVTVAQRLYVLQVQALDFSAARNTFARLRDSDAARRSDAYEGTIAALTASYERIEELVAGQDRLVLGAKIGTHDYWVHDLLRRSFSMGDVNGRIDVVDIRCDRATKRYDSFPKDAVWQIPESWGQCGVYIKGEPGTTFVFEEYPLGTAATELTRD